MFLTATRSLLRQPVRTFRPQPTRYLSTAPPHLKSRSWRNSAARWGIAVAGIYYYNTSTLFAEEPAPILHEPPSSEDDLPTLQSLSPSSRFQPPHPSDAPSIAPTPTASSPPSIDPKAPAPSEPSSPHSPEALEEEASQQGAFNEETGEINWDCPCLGGMADGPCGPQFREAFSCFVFSKEEPKGMDCIDRFKGMQDCFREHPDVYGAELEDDEEEEMRIREEEVRKHEEGAKVAGALPEDAPGVAAGGGISRGEEGGETVTAAVQRRAAEAKEQVKESMDDLGRRATDAKHTVGEKIQDAKDRAEAFLKPEEGGHEVSPDSDPNAGKSDGKLVSDRRHSTSGAVEDMEEEGNQLVPKAAHDATDKGSGKTTEK
ncbi:MAG: Oxidoreductase [Stictis urceolatum]|nr:Oxidoreductase [Stictis urceolata]